MSNMKHGQLLIFFLAIFAARNSVAQDKTFFCHLEWVPAASSSAIPQHAVEANAPESVLKSYIIRGSATSNTSLLIGVYDTELDKSFISTNGQVVEMSAFELLTNPYGCDVTWTFDASHEYKFPITPGETNNFVGRALVGQHWYPGHVKYLDNTIEVIVNREVYAPDEFQYLISYNQGLSLELFNFTMDFNPFSQGTLDFVGQDTIHNNADASVSLTVSHKKMVRQITKVTVEKKWMTEKVTKFKYRFFWLNYEKTETHKVTEKETKTYTKTEETEIEVSRNILIKPYQSIQACSVVNMQKGISIKYKATGMYVGAGMTPNEIKEATIGIEGVYELAGQILVEMDGELGGDTAVSTKFTVAPYGSCDFLRKEIEASQIYI